MSRVTLFVAVRGVVLFTPARRIAACFLTLALSTTPIIAVERSLTEYPPSSGEAIETGVKDSPIDVKQGDTENQPPVEQNIVKSILALLHDHPELLALENQKQALLERRQVSLALPDPTLSLGINNLSVSSPSFDEFLPTNKFIGIRQEFPSRKGRNARAEQALTQSFAIDLMITARRESLLAEVLEHLIEKRRINQQVGLARDRLEKYDQLTEVVESEIKAGSPSVFRLPEIDAERARVLGLINDLNAQTLEHNARLIALISEVPGFDVPAVTAIDWSGDYEQFHKVRIAQAELNSVRESLTIADASRFKRWGVQLAYQQREAGDNFSGDDWVSGQVFVSVPLWYGQSQLPEQRAAAASVEAARQNLMLVQRNERAQYAAFKARVQAAIENINLQRREVTAIQDKIATQVVSYEAAIGYFSPIIDGDIALLKLRAEILAEQATIDIYNARIASLLVETGS